MSDNIINLKMSDPQAASGEGLTYEKACKIRSIGTYAGSGIIALAALLKFIHAAGESLTLRIIVTCVSFIILAALMVLEER